MFCDIGNKQSMLGVEVNWFGYAEFRGVARNFSRRGGGLNFFSMELKNLGRFWNFFLKNLSKLKDFSEMVGVLTPKTRAWLRPWRKTWVIISKILIIKYIVKFSKISFRKSKFSCSKIEIFTFGNQTSQYLKKFS